METLKHKVQLRSGFSDRNGIAPINTEIQVNSLDERTRTALINLTHDAFSHMYQCKHVGNEINMYIAHVFYDIYGFERDQIRKLSNAFEEAKKLILHTIRNDTYDAVLTVLEDMIRNMEYFECKHKAVMKSFVAQRYNRIFEREYVGYRFLNGQMTPITDQQELAAIEEATTDQQMEVEEHLDKALGFLSDRNAPDYENSIKESISAVERMCSIIMGESTTLGDALKHLEDRGIMIHGALKTAFQKLYGYTSDGSGIRHAGELGGPGATFEEAKFMLVSCCAFINYLKGVMAKTS